MDVYEALQKLTKVIHDETGCYGTDEDVKHVKAFLKAKPAAQSDERLYVSGMEFGNFYAFCEVQFNKTQLWTAIKAAFPAANAQPPGWTFRSTLGSMAMYLA